MPDSVGRPDEEWRQDPSKHPNMEKTLQKDHADALKQEDPKALDCLKTWTP